MNTEIGYQKYAAVWCKESGCIGFSKKSSRLWDFKLKQKEKRKEKKIFYHLRGHPSRKLTGRSAESKADYGGPAHEAPQRAKTVLSRGLETTQVALWHIVICISPMSCEYF